MKNSIFSVLSFALLIVTSSCQNHKEELKHLGNLQETLESNNEYLDLDIPLFKTRIEFIDKTLRTFRNNYTDTMSLELGNSLSRYKAIKKIYTKNTTQYSKNKKDQMELKTQLENLKTDLNNGKLTKEEFKGFFNTEKTDVLALIESSKYIKKTLYEVEPDYKRITEELLPILEQIENSRK